MSSPETTLPMQPGDNPGGRDPLEALATQYLEQIRRGEHPQIEDYATAHPGLASQIRELFPFMVALEDWKADRELQDVKRVVPEKLQFDRLGNCRLIREIGRGGMGVVYEAEEAPVGRRVALKLLPWRFSKSSRWRAQFLREARIAAGLRHSHIVPVFSFGEDNGWCYYVMQLIEGVGLDRIISWLGRDAGVVSVEEIYREFWGRSDVPTALRKSQRTVRREAWSQLAKIALQATSGLQYAHQQGTLHRDIKPGNLLMDTQGSVWITDFGLALAGDQARLAGQLPLAGTLRFMAPEQFSGQCDCRSDIYSLGATIYHLWTGQVAFPGDDREQLIADILQGRKIRPTKHVRQLPAALERIILKAMQRRPEKRYQTTHAMVADLLKFLNIGQRSWHQRFRGWLWSRFVAGSSERAGKE